jgi:heme exporter protein CcmD
MPVIASLFDMGEHAAFIWSALAVTVTVMVLLLAVSWRGARRNARNWNRLREKTRELRESADETEA